MVGRQAGMPDKQKATTNQLMDSHDTRAIDFCALDKLTTEMSNVFRYYALIWDSASLISILWPWAEFRTHSSIQ